MISRRPPRLQRAKPIGTFVLPELMPSSTIGPKNKIIQSVWIGSSLSSMESLCIRSFIANGHEFHLYVHGKCSEIPNGTVIKDANEILPESEITKFRSVTIFSDLFRYLLLKRGVSPWYVDMDTIALRPFEFSEDYIFASEFLQNGHRLVDNGILKLPADSALLSELINRCQQQDPMNPSGKLSHGALAMGPELMTELAEKFNMLEYVKAPAVFTGIVPWEIPQTFVDPTYSANLTEAYAAHMWQSRWTTTGQDKNGVYHTKSLFEILKQRYPSV